MDFTLSDEVLENKKQARKWVEEVLNPMSVPLEEEEKFPPELAEELRNGRFFGLTIPKEYGGEGWNVLQWFPVLEEFAKAYATVRLIAHTMNGLFWRPLYHFGTEEQKRTYLPKLASGEIWSANSLTEPEAGTGKDINTKAVRHGEDFIINGHKWLITLFPGYTKLIYAFGATEKGHTAFLVDYPSKGVELKPMEKMMGCVGPRHFNVIYKDCHEPAW